MGRGVRIVSVRLGEDPPGFLSSEQAIAGRGREATSVAGEMFSVLSADVHLTSTMLEGLVVQWERAANFSDGISLMKRLEVFKAIPDHLLRRLESAFETNDQLHGAGGLSRRFPDFVHRHRAVGAPGGRG